MNPWLARVTQIPTFDEIRSATRKDGQHCADLLGRNPETAQRSLQQSLSDIFVPDDQRVEILEMWLSAAAGFAAQYYSSEKALIDLIYKDAPPFSAEENPSFYLLTGHAGVGKSHLLAAFTRMMPPPLPGRLNARHPEYLLQPHIHVKAGVRPSVTEVLDGLLPADRYAGERIATSIDRRRIAAKHGVCFHTVDELQSISLSAGAKALLCAAALNVRSLGLPAVLSLNYSHAWKLCKSDPQISRRVTENPIDLLPDEASSPGWRDYLSEIQKVMPEIFSFQLTDKAVELNSLIAGLRGKLVSLILVAFRSMRKNARKSIAYDDLTAAYRSGAFSSHRSDIESIQSARPSRNPKASECPFLSPFIDMDEQSGIQDQTSTERVEGVAATAIVTTTPNPSLTDLEHLESARTRAGATSKVVRLPVANSREKSALLENLDLFRAK